MLACSAKTFLAERHRNSFGIVSEVEKCHRDLSGKSSLECINEVVMGSQQLATMKGVFFEISVPVKSDIFSIIPWNKMEQKWFGMNRNGIFSIDRNTGEVRIDRASVPLHLSRENYWFKKFLFFSDTLNTQTI